MTQTIDEATQGRARQPTPRPVTPPRSPLVAAVRAFTAVTTAVAVFLAAAEIASDAHSRNRVIAALTALFLATAAGAVLCLRSMFAEMLAETVADRVEFYRRGQLSGWMRGWRGQEPEVEDPILR